MAERRRLRALGLMWLPRELAPPGLLIPCCSSVHTLWMRFPIEVVFLDASGAALERRRVAPRRLAGRRGADAVLELPLQVV